jgi:DNA-binding response OmpR family regulator
VALSRQQKHRLTDVLKNRDVVLDVVSNLARFAGTSLPLNEVETKVLHFLLLRERTIVPLALISSITGTPESVVDEALVALRQRIKDECGRHYIHRTANNEYVFIARRPEGNQADLERELISPCVWDGVKVRSMCYIPQENPNQRPLF